MTKEKTKGIKIMDVKKIDDEYLKETFKEKPLSDNILNLRRYLPDNGCMKYWIGDTPDNRGIYVDLGAVVGNLKQAIKRLEGDIDKWMEGRDGDIEFLKFLIKRRFGDKLTGG